MCILITYCYTNVASETLKLVRPDDDVVRLYKLLEFVSASIDFQQDSVCVGKLVRQVVHIGFDVRRCTHFPQYIHTYAHRSFSLKIRSFIFEMLNNFARLRALSGSGRKQLRTFAFITCSSLRDSTFSVFLSLFFV